MDPYQIAHKDEFKDMISILDLNLNILGLTETRLIKDQSPIFKTSIDGHEEYHTPTQPYILIKVLRVNPVKT